MKAILVFIFGISASSFCFAQDAATLRTDKQSYLSNEKAVLLVSLKPLPQNSADEYFVIGTFEGGDIRTFKLANTEFVAITQPLQSGSKSWNVNIYLQNKAAVENLGLQIVAKKNELKVVTALLKGETDSAKIADLTNAKTSLEGEIVSLNNQVVASRTLLESKSKTFNVASATIRSKAINDALVLSSSSSNNTFVRGENATITMTVAPEHFGAIEEQETDILASFDGISVLANSDGLGGYTYDFSTSALATGDFVFTSSLYLQDKAASRSIRVALQAGGVRKIQQELYRDSTYNKKLADYYQHEVDDLNYILNALHSILASYKSLAVTKSLTITVVPPPPVVLSVTSLALEEGAAFVAYTVTLNNPPTGDVTVAITTNSNDIDLSTDQMATQKSLNLIFTQQNWAVPQTVYTQVPNDSVIEGTRSASINHTVSGGGYDTVTVPSIAVTINDPVAALVCDPSTIYMYGSWAYDSYNVTLPHQPTGSVEVTIDTLDGYHFILNYGSQGMGTTLYFDQWNWNQPQTVQITQSGWGGFTQIYPFIHTVTGDASIKGCDFAVDYTAF
ncbi:hypothetical protein ACLWBD_12790 [Bdellovibrio sp. HCB117]|uniref:hypothetical protein n=1 Tax=Bdellovibrio sp. HCB117 TaxID=3394359 RepID=UPI0039B649F0